MHPFDDDDNQAFEVLHDYYRDSSNNAVAQTNGDTVLVAVVVVPKNQVMLYDDDTIDLDDMVDQYVVNCLYRISNIYLYLYMNQRADICIYTFMIWWCIFKLASKHTIF